MKRREKKQYRREVKIIIIKVGNERNIEVSEAEK